MVTQTDFFIQQSIRKKKWQSKIQQHIPSRLYIDDDYVAHSTSSLLSVSEEVLIVKINPLQQEAA